MSWCSNLGFRGRLCFHWRCWDGGHRPSRGRGTILSKMLAQGELLGPQIKIRQSDWLQYKRAYFQIISNNIIPNKAQDSGKPLWAQLPPHCCHHHHRRPCFEPLSPGSLLPCYYNWTPKIATCFIPCLLQNRQKHRFESEHLFCDSTGRDRVFHPQNLFSNQVSRDASCHQACAGLHFTGSDFQWSLVWCQNRKK